MAIGRPIEQTPNIADKVVTATATAGQTEFTVTGGYRINHLAVFRNGVRLVNGNDFTALDGTTVTLMEDASNLDVLEFQVFDSFSVSDALLTNAASQTVNGDVTVTGTFTVGTGGIGTFVAAEVNVGIVSSNTGITTVQSLQAASSTTTGALQVKGGVGIGKSLYVGGNVSVGGTLTYEDVTNVDSVGVVTAGKGVRITTGGLVVTAGVSTFAGITTVTNTAALHSKQLNVSAGSTFGGAITASDTLTVAGNVSIADKIIHTGDTDTAIRFPSANTITAETSGSERLRIDLRGNMGLGANSIDNAASGNDTVFAIRGKGSSYSGRIEFQDSSGNKDATIQVDSGILDIKADPDTASTNSMIRTFVDNSEKLRITSTGGFQFSNGLFDEKCNITAGKLSGNTNIDLANGMVHYFSTQESTTSTPNIRINDANTLQDAMGTGDICTVTLITTAAAAGYSANLTIDGNAVTEEWVGGAAPSEGGADGLDIYTYTIICIGTGTGDSGFKVIANLTNATN